MLIRDDSAVDGHIIEANRVAAGVRAIAFRKRRIGRALVLVLAGVGLGCGGGSNGCGSGGGSNVPRGAVSIAWTLGDLEGHPATCDEVGASTVALSLRDHSSGASTTASLPCATSPGTTQPVPAGTYDITIRLQAADGTTLATAAGRTDVAVAAGAATVLPPAVFFATTKGGLVISLAASGAATNCGARDAGITGLFITMIRSSGSCAPVTFVRSRGSTQLGTYTVNCGTPHNAGCVEADETLTVPQLDPDTYEVHVRANVGALNCWNNDDVLDVPLRPSPLVRTLTLVRQSSPGC
jgi:hypothetical protein